MELFTELGFCWDWEKIPQQIPIHLLERVCFRFHRMLPEFVWEASVLAGNPFTYPEVKSLLDGVTVGGRQISDQAQILNLAQSAKRLLAMVKTLQFRLDKASFCEFHSLVACYEALKWGHFRGEGHEIRYTPNVGLGEHGNYTPLPTVAGADELHKTFMRGVAALKEYIRQPFEQAAGFFLFGALQKFFFDGNKRTSHFMMNAILQMVSMQSVCLQLKRRHLMKRWCAFI